jgi:hypothetical protein
MKKATAHSETRKGLLKRWFPKRYRRARTILIIIAVLVVLRILLPYFVLYLVNNRLENTPGYYGHVDDVDISIFRGAYSLHDSYLNEVDSATGEQTPFLEAKKIDLSIEWGELFRGKIVGEVVADAFVVKFTKDKMTPGQVKEDKNILQELGDDFMPLKLNRVELRNSRIHYIDPYSDVPLDIHMDNFYLLAKNLRTEKDTALLPSTLVVSADVYEGKFMVGGKMDLLADKPTFDLNAGMRGVNLPKLNDFFRKYAKIDVNSGEFGLYLEAAARNGALKGYVKPFLKHLDVVGHEDRDDNLLNQMWEHVIGAVGVIFRNQKEDQVATKIPFEGNLEDANANIWVAIYEVVYNAFIHALNASIDNEISIDSVQEISDEKSGLKGLFKKDEDKKDKKRNDKKDDGKKDDGKKNDKQDPDKAKREREREKAREERKEKREERREAKPEGSRKDDGSVSSK